jgi:hypothetical protein
MTGYLVSIASPPPAFFRLGPGRTYTHRVASSATDGIDRITITAACGVVCEVNGTVVLSAVCDEASACPNCIAKE